MYFSRFFFSVHSFISLSTVHIGNEYAWDTPSFWPISEFFPPKLQHNNKDPHKIAPVSHDPLPVPVGKTNTFAGEKLTVLKLDNLSVSNAQKVKMIRRGHFRHRCFPLGIEQLGTEGRKIGNAGFVRKFGRWSWSIIYKICVFPIWLCTCASLLKKLRFLTGSLHLFFLQKNVAHHQNDTCRYI